MVAPSVLWNWTIIAIWSNSTSLKHPPNRPCTGQAEPGGQAARPLHGAPNRGMESRQPPGRRSGSGRRSAHRDSATNAPIDEMLRVRTGRKYHDLSASTWARAAAPGRMPSFWTRSVRPLTRSRECYGRATVDMSIDRPTPEKFSPDSSSFSDPAPASPPASLPPPPHHAPPRETPASRARSRARRSTCRPSRSRGR